MKNDRDYILKLQASIFPAKHNHEHFLAEWNKLNRGFFGEETNYTPNQFCDSFDITIEQFSELTGPTYKDLTNKKIIIDPFLKALDEKTFEKLKVVLVGTLPEQSINAETYKGPFGTPIVVFNNGLNWIIEHFKYIQTFKSQENNSDDSRYYYLDELRKLQLLFLNNGVQNESLIKMPLDLENLLRSSIQVQFIKLFVFAHEFANIYLNHLEDSGKSQLRTLSEHTLNESKVYNRSQIMEFEADELAFSWYEQFLNSDSDLTSYANEKQLDLVRVLPFEFLYMVNLFQAPLIIKETISEEKTHPSSLDRLKRLFDLNRKNLKEKETEKINEMITEGEKQVDLFIAAKRKIEERGDKNETRE